MGFVREDGDNLLVFKGTTEFIQQEANTLEAICNKFKTSQENVGPATTKKVDVTLLSKRSSKAVIRDREEAKLKEKRRLENQQRKQLLQKFKQDLVKDKA